MFTNSIGLLCRPCRFPLTVPFATRGFQTSQSVLARHKQPKIRVPSKKTLAAKAKRRAAKARKNIYDSEKMPLLDAIAVLRAVEVAKPNATYELFVKTQIKNGVAIPKGRVNLPREAKSKTEDKILVFAEGRQAEEAKKAGAHVVGGPELIDAVISNRHQATTILCTTSLIRTITPKLGRVLGPLGLMPSERRGTVTDDIAGYIQRLYGTSEWRADKSGSIHTAIAKLHFPIDDVVKNVRHFMTSVKRVTGNQRDKEDKKTAKPVTSISKVMLSSGQGPGIQISDF
ncbi:ribosomal protein L1 [Pleurotus eryngii]|uniref:Ribosomal protein L1 n=1 Tax=Pleurotus eryngii TaxID=5323 RepID=A0A9P6ABZ2_PLEER|nr:ribosomal protein L1 [Pleurotus eryngii]